MTFRVFICHSYGHRDIYYELIQKLNDSKYFDWRNLSVQYDMRFGTTDDEADNDELREEISKKIRDCEVFLALTKPVASRRRWLQWVGKLNNELPSRDSSNKKKNGRRSKSEMRRRKDSVCKRGAIVVIPPLQLLMR